LVAYEVSEWSDLFVAAAGAGAALAGLVFVAVSINLERILVERNLPARALQTLVMLVIVVAVSLVCLIPGQDLVALGIELLILACGYAFVLVRTAQISLAASPAPVTGNALRLLLLASSGVPLLIGSVSVLAETGGGLYWIAAGILGAIAGGVTNAWVLLVEIQR
jgi:modulator of FtsH protease